MKKLNEYDINLVNLKDKIHEYDFDLDNDFFALFEQSLVNGGSLHAHVVLDKSSLLLNFDFFLKGTVNLTCDRSLDNFDYPVEIKENLLVKYGEREMELDDNVLQIPQNTQNLNLAQHLFDYVGLAIPMKKLHPRFVDDDNTDDDILIYSTVKNDNSADDENSPEELADPRWEILKNLNKN